MAIKTCAVTSLVSGTAVTTPETTAITAADTVTITGGSDAARLLLLLNNTAAAEKEITIKAGESPPALRKGIGDDVVKIPEKSTSLIAVESARHANKDGTISITFSSGTTGFISAVKLPKAL